MSCDAINQEVETKNVFPVEKVLDKRKNRKSRKLEYFLKWKGYSNSNNSWVRKEDICPKLIADFERQRKEAPKKRRGRPPQAKSGDHDQPVNVSLLPTADNVQAEPGRSLPMSSRRAPSSSRSRSPPQTQQRSSTRSLSSSEDSIYVEVVPATRETSQAEAETKGPGQMSSSVANSELKSAEVEKVKTSTVMANGFPEAVNVEIEVPLVAAGSQAELSKVHHDHDYLCCSQTYYRRRSNQIK